MSAGVGVLGAKRRAKGVDLRHRAGITLHVELTRHREKCLGAEEVVRIVGIPVDGIEGGYAEQLTRTFAVAGCDDGCVDPYETVALEVAMHGLRYGVAHPGDSAEGVGARTQVRLGSEVLERVVLLGDGVAFGIVHPAYDLDFLRLYFPVLAPPGGFYKCARHPRRAAGAHFHDFGGVVRQRAVGNGLQSVEAGAVV